MTPLARTTRHLVIGLLVAPLVLVALASPGSAADFYDTPTTLPPGNGDLVRSEPSSFFLDPARALRAPAQAHRIMYRSSDRDDTPIAVTGTVLVPDANWNGPTPTRPLIAFAAGTQGLGDQCAPSRQLAAGSEYEGVFIKGLLARGYAVVVTDYQGLGTEGLHTYISREVTARAVLDSARAALELDAVDIADDTPVALAGYSQGGAASAAAAEIAGTYAPELDIVGASAGAPPADLGPVAKALDGSLYFAFLGYALGGLSESYDLDLGDVLNDRGDDVLAGLSGQCTAGSVATFPFVRSGTLTEDGRPLTEWFAEQPFASVIAEQRIGTVAPAFPTLVTHSRFDDVIPFRVGRVMARGWCADGATVHFSANLAAGHIGGALAHFPTQFAFLERRFADRTPIDNCGWF